TKQKHEEGKDVDPMIVSVTADKKVWLEKDPVTDDQLKEALGGKLAAEPWKPILVKGDQSLTFGDVRRVLKDAQDAKAKTVKLGVEGNTMTLGPNSPLPTTRNYPIRHAP